MTSNALSCQDIIDSGKKYEIGDLYKVHIIKNRSPKHIDTSKSGGGKVSYFKHSWHHANGKWVACNLKFNNQIINSPARLPKEGADTAKFVSVSIIKMERNAIEGGDYVKPDYPKNASDEKKKEIDDMFEKTLDVLVENNDKLIKALTIIGDAHLAYWAEERKSLNYSKQRYISKEAKICKPYQDEAEDEDGGMITLEKKIFRFNIPIVPFNSKYLETTQHQDKIGFFNYKDSTFTPTVFRLNGKEAVLCDKSKGKKRKIPLNKENCGKYITYKSLISGEMSFTDVSASKFGISMKMKIIRKLYVKRHKSGGSADSHTAKELAMLNNISLGFKKDEDSDDEIDINDGDDDNDDGDDGDDEKTPTPSPAEADSEPDDNSDDEDDSPVKEPVEEPEEEPVVEKKKKHKKHKKHKKEKKERKQEQEKKEEESGDESD